MAALKNIVVAGGASYLGPHILAALHHSNFNITAIHRPNSTNTYPPYVKSIETDFSPSSLLSAFKNQDAVISVLGFDGIPEQMKMIDAATQAGIKRFVPSEFGWSKDLPMMPELEARMEIKKKSYEYLLQKCKEYPGMTWSAIASGVFIDWCLKKIPTIGFHLPSHTATIYDSGTEPISCTTGSAIGTAVSNLLLNPSETANRYLKISSFKTNQNEILKALEGVTGVEWVVKRKSTKEVVEERGELVRKGQFGLVFGGVIACQLFEDGGGRGVTVEVGGSDNGVLGVEEVGVEEALKEILTD